MKHCPFCAEEIQDKAIVCKHCNRDLPLLIQASPPPQKTKKSHPLLIGCIGLLVVIYILFLVAPKQDANKTTNVSRPSMELAAEIPIVPPLELISWNWSFSYGYAIAEGQVKNVSGELIKNVEAVVSWKTKDGDFITSSDALLEYNPILPNQVSPFKVMATENPAMHQASIEFKTLMGSTIEHTVREKSKKVK